MSSAPPLHGSELPSSSTSNRSLLLQPWQRGPRDCGYRFGISRFGFGVKYSGFLHLDPCFLLCCTSSKSSRVPQITISLGLFCVDWLQHSLSFKFKQSTRFPISGSCTRKEADLSSSSFHQNFERILLICKILCFQLLRRPGALVPILSKHLFTS